MASILNQTREVLKVELTKHGRKMLAAGVFLPSYYSFYDNSIIYDNSYYGVSENTNEIEERLLDKSLTLTNLNSCVDVLGEPLGTSNVANEFAPAWDLELLKGNITFIKEHSTYYKNKFNFKNISYSILKDEENNLKNPIIQSDYILIDLEELNVSDDYENFELELVTFDEISGNNKTYIKDGKSTQLERKLFFVEKKSNIIDDILYENDELPSKYYDVKIDENDVSYYYDIQVDDEIDREFIGMLLKNKIGSALDNQSRIPNIADKDNINNNNVQNNMPVADPINIGTPTGYSGPVGSEC